MKLMLICLLALMMISGETDGQADNLNGRSMNIFRLLRDFGLGLVGRSASEPRLLRRADVSRRLQKRMPESSEFPCFKGSALSRPPPRSKVRPKSVHELRPGDFDLVAGMGDSLTAGNGAAATNILQVYTENRGVSWSIGGQGTWREFLTIPNILKEFNPKLFGYSLGDALGHHHNAQFNVAEIGAMSRDLPFMAKQLVKRIKQDPRVDLENDWKLVTLMIGANDFCIDTCFQNDTEGVPERHRAELHEALMTLKKNLPRTFVSIVPAPDVEILKNFTGVKPLCEVSHLFECPCFFGETHKHLHKKYVKLIHQWQDIDLEMPNLPEFNDGDDFIVVSQPFVKGITFPTSGGITDYSYLSTDCFHFSQKGYARAANALWNNMLEPVGNKSHNWYSLFKKFACPTLEHPYISTWKNSGMPHPSYADGLIESNLLKRSIRV